jgi:hypothetical protein
MGKDPRGLPRQFALTIPEQKDIVLLVLPLIMDSWYGDFSVRGNIEQITGPLWEIILHHV